MRTPRRRLPPDRSPASLPRARKRFGQHFLVDRSILCDIARRVDVRPGDVVLEVGPGRGALTEPLLERLERLVAVEIDRDLCAHLRAHLGDAGAPAGGMPPAGSTTSTAPSEGPRGNLRLLEGDVLQLDLHQLLVEESGRAIVVVANLPYNITAPVLLRLRAHADLVRRAVITLQREVAERLVAPPGSRVYGQLSVLLGQCARLRLGRLIPASAFKPRPRVDSAVLEIDFEPNRVPVADLRAFDAVVRAAFGQRRKMLRNALRSLAGVAGPEAAAVNHLSEAGVDLSQRAEDLSVAQFARLADALAAGMRR